MLGLIDIGANLTHPELYNQLDRIVNNLRAENIEKVIITSSNDRYIFFLPLLPKSLDVASMLFSWSWLLG